MSWKAIKPCHKQALSRFFGFNCSVLSPFLFWEKILIYNRIEIGERKTTRWHAPFLWLNNTPKAFIASHPWWGPEVLPENYIQAVWNYSTKSVKEPRRSRRYSRFHFYCRFLKSMGSKIGPPSSSLTPPPGIPPTSMAGNSPSSGNSNSGPPSLELLLVERAKALQANPAALKAFADMQGMYQAQCWWKTIRLAQITMLYASYCQCGAWRQLMLREHVKWSIGNQEKRSSSRSLGLL